MALPLKAWFFIVIAGALQVASISFALTSSSFKNNSTIPNRYSYDSVGCTGQNLSPALAWSPGPDETKSYALTVFDPDARAGVGWWHWVAFDIPSNVTKLSEGAGKGTGDQMPKGAIQGRNDFQTLGYAGPCPPPGDAPHHYIFTVYALDVEHLPGVSPLTSGPTLLNVLKGHVLSKAAVVGRFGR